MPTIFIISSYLMFSHGLKNLLRRETELNIVGQAQNVDRAIEQIQELQPDVVIIYTDDVPDKSTSAVVDILKIKSNIKVIALNLQDNSFHVYQATRWVATSLDDLVEAIEADPVPTSLAADAARSGKKNLEARK